MSVAYSKMELRACEERAAEEPVEARLERTEPPAGSAPPELPPGDERSREE